LRITCGNGHNVEIIPEHINILEEKHTTKYFVTNYKLFLLMQLLGKCLKSVANVTALLGIFASFGFCTTWKSMLDKLGTIKTNLA